MCVAGLCRNKRGPALSGACRPLMTAETYYICHTMYSTLLPVWVCAYVSVFSAYANERSLVTQVCIFNKERVVIKWYQAQTQNVRSNTNMHTQTHQHKTKNKKICHYSRAGGWLISGNQSAEHNFSPEGVN